ncbi:MAG: TIGR04438 family Trp-rich protein [Rubrivivax sp.]
MPFVIIGVLLLVAKVADFSVFATWSWWIILAPFAAAVVWWQLSDSLGLTQKRAMDKMEQRKVDRRERQLAALGIDTKKKRSAGGSRSGAQPTPRPARDAAKLGAAVDPTQVNGSITPSRKPETKR